jgi:hypothetical protein
MYGLPSRSHIWYRYSCMRSGEPSWQQCWEYCVLLPTY